VRRRDLDRPRRPRLVDPTAPPPSPRALRRHAGDAEEAVIFQIAQNDLTSFWHVVRSDGRTVCGRPIDKNARRSSATSEFKRKLCKSCDRMKGAEGMRLA
jgi:hypothetical protein